MKLFLSILILLMTSLSFGVALELIDLSHIKISLVDFLDEGSSEKDSSENAEDDTEKNTSNLMNLSNRAMEQSSILTSNNNFKIGNFTKIFNPPPKRA